MKNVCGGPLVVANYPAKKYQCIKYEKLEKSPLNLILVTVGALGINVEEINRCPQGLQANNG